MTSKDEAVWSGVFKWIPGEDLERYTREGWALVSGYQGTEQVLEADPRTNRMDPIERNMFLVCFEEGNELARKDAELKSFRDSVVQKRTELAKQKKHADELQEQLEEATNTARGRREELDRYEQVLDAERQRSRRMEEDLAKVRKEIGEATMRQIVGH